MKKKYDELVERERNCLISTYGRYPLSVERAQGTKLYDHDGREYLDLLAGVAVVSLGHCRPELADIMAEQARKLVHVSNLFYQEEQLVLAEKLLKTCEADKVFFCNSGAESNESAIKLARRYMSRVRKNGAYEVITLEGSFHGRTLATLTATGQEGMITDGFEPFPQGFKTVPLGDIEALKQTVTDKTAAVMIEMIQGESGVKPLPTEYVGELAEFCRDKGILLIVDEVQTGLCRTGKFWAHQHFGIKPDIFTSAKALANGLPLGAMFATDEVAKGFEPGSHATTFGGSALLTSVSSKVVDIMLEENLAGHAAEMGEFMRGELENLSSRHPGKIDSIRCIGLMVGIELSFPGKDVWNALLDKGFVLNLTKDRILRLVPPLIIEKVELLSFVKALDEVLETLKS